MEIICIGDSITNGYPFSPAQSWVGLLSEKSLSSFINCGENGETTRDIRRRIEGCLANHSGGIATLMAGTNDFIFTESAPEDVAASLSAMAGQCLNYSILPLLMPPILTIPEMARAMWTDGTDYNQVNEKLFTLRHLLESYAAEQSLPYFDLQSAYQRFTEKCGAIQCYVDGIHPTAEGYKMLAELIGSALDQIKEKSRENGI